MACAKCSHGEEYHIDNICEGDRFCTCFKYVTMQDVISIIKDITPRKDDGGVMYSRTDVPLPQPISTHDNWKGTGWDYQKKWNMNQRDMVAFLKYRCGLPDEDVRIFLRCKKSSVRGRLSEIRNHVK